MADLNAYTVLQPFDLPHCEEGEHEQFAPCENCDKRGMVEAGPGLFKLCPVCKGTREGGPSLGPAPCDHVAARYAPGQTVHLSERAAATHLALGRLAPAGSDVDLLLLKAAASRAGYDLVEAK